MMHTPFGFLDWAWLAFRLFLLALAVWSHPLAYDLRGFGLVIPPQRGAIAYTVFESVEFAVFTWAVFFWDTLPGMRHASAYLRVLRANLVGASLLTVIWKSMPFALALGCATWFIITPLALVRDAFPIGWPRFYAATAYFVIERLVIIVGFLLAADYGSDDDPGMRRRRVLTYVATMLRLKSVRRTATIASR